MARVYKHQITISYMYVNNWHILSGFPCSSFPALLRRAVKTASSQAISWISQKLLQQRKSITVYCFLSGSLFFILDYFSGYIVTISNSQLPASNVINKIHINTAKSRIHDIPPWDKMPRQTCVTIHDGTKTKLEWSLSQFSGYEVY